MKFLGLGKKRSGQLFCPLYFGLDLEKCPNDFVSHSSIQQSSDPTFYSIFISKILEIYFVFL